MSLVLAAVWIAADQATKWWAEATLERGQGRDFIPGFLEFRLVYNPGAAFSLVTNATVLLTIFASGVVIFLILMARRLGSWPWAIGLGLLLGGAAGNLIDRFFRAPGPGRGHVVDFLRFENFPFIDFPVFNIADIGVTSAAILIALLALLGIAPDGSKGAAAGAEDEDELASEEARSGGPDGAEGGSPGGAEDISGHSADDSAEGGSVHGDAGADEETEPGSRAPTHDEPSPQAPVLGEHQESRE